MCFGCRGFLRTAGMIMPFLLAVTSCGLYSPSLAAVQLVNFSVGVKQGIYHLALVMILDARFTDVHYVITDYAHIYRIDPSIVESGILGKPYASVTRVQTLINDCVLFFCRDILRVEDVREVGDDDIYAVIIPQLSTARSGTEHWQILPRGPRTRINYHMTLDPGFLVPPLIGDHIVEKKLKEEVLICFNNIERLARIHNKQLRAHDTTLSTDTASDHGKAN